MDGTAQVFQTPGVAVCMSCIQNMSGVKGRAHSAVIQHHIAGLHAFTISASLQGLIKALKFKASFALTKYLTSYPSASTGTGLFNSHSCVVHHVVDGAKEWRNLAEETAKY